MQVQHRTEINISSGNKAEVNNSAKSSAVEARDAQQDNAFKDQLNKQIDQSKNADVRENNYNKQEDREIRKSNGKTAEETKNNSEDQASDAKTVLDTDVDTEVNADKSAEVVLNINQQMPLTATQTETLEEVMELPDNGKSLPLTDLVEEVIVTVGSPAQQNSQKTGGAPVESFSDSEKLANQIPAQLKPATMFADVAASVKPQSVVNSEAAPVAYKAVNVADKVVFTPTDKLAPVNSEMPASEVITQATRLQQVALTTAISASNSTAQNINTNMPNILGDMSATLSNTGITTSSLNSAITTNIQNPQWSQKMTEQVSFMLKGGFQQAEIKLNPAHLGPMEIKLTMNDDKATVSFVAQHAPVREALDSAIPRLREMLEQQGINLADVDVSTKSQQQQSENESSTMAKTGEESLEDSMDATGEQSDGQNAVMNVDLETGVSIFA